MSDDNYEFDIAISFGLKDEDFANRLHNLFDGRMRVFIYSKQQEQLAGADGEQRFNEAFGQKSRLVVVLFREAWGKTPFTRFEETAIRNRAYADGYDFTVFIPMDDTEKQKVPQWLPKNRLYVGLSRWGIEGAAAVIEARFNELGGSVREETIDDVAARTARVLAFNRQRDVHLSTDAGVVAQTKSFDLIRSGLLSAVVKLQNTLPDIQLSEKHSDSAGGAIIFLSNPAAMSVNFQRQYWSSLKDSNLEISLWEGHPPWPGIMTIDGPTKLSTLRYVPDLLLDGNPGWKKSHDKPVSSSQVVDDILKFFLAKVERG